jgi:hypothetical protein
MTMKSVRFVFCFVAIGLALAVTGCNRDTLLVTIKSPQDLNAGRPVRMLIRAVDQQEYVNESYLAVADKVVVKDDSVLYSAVVYPQLPLMVSVKKGEKSIGVYFFFTQPGSRWKTLLEMPLPHVTEIRLSQSNIDSVKQH